MPPQGDVEQLTQRVTCVLGQNPSAYTLNGTNCYLVGSGPQRLLVDAGEARQGAAFMEKLAQGMEEQQVEGLCGVLITHMHFDHYGNVGRLQEAYGPVPVYTAELPPPSALIQGLRARGLERHLLGADGRPLFDPLIGAGAQGLAGLPFEASAASQMPQFPQGADLAWAAGLVRSFPGDCLEHKVCASYFYQWHSAQLFDALRQGTYDWRLLRDGDVVCTEGATLRVLHTPGHAADHMSFLLEEEHALFSGDHVLGWGTTLVFDMRDYMATLRRMLDLKPTRLYPGHGPLVEDAVDLLTRYIGHRERRETQAWEALARRGGPVDIAEVALELYPDTPPERQELARENVEALFRKFVTDGAAVAFRAGDEGRLAPFEVPRTAYAVRRLEAGILFAARSRSPALPGGPSGQRLHEGGAPTAKL